MQTLTTEDILSVHNSLVEEFAETNDPIFPSGVKSEALLESAAARQTAGFGNFTRHTTIEGVAASLLYGITNNHPFHNGNKRTALVSMLVFLDNNNRVIAGVPHSDLYKLVTKVAAHTICDGQRESPDDEVEHTRRWLRKNCRAQETGERAITFRQLKRILDRFGYTLEDGNHASIYKMFEHRTLFTRKLQLVKQKVMDVPYPGEGTEVGRKLLRNIRKTLKLSDEHGIDSRSFYDDQSLIDAFIARHQSLLRRLAKA